MHELSNAAFLIFACLVFAGLAVWAWRTGCRAESAPGAFLPPALGFALALMLLFSPHYPWYVAWLIPLVVLLPSLTVLTYVGGLFFLCTTALAVGSGPPQYHLNEILYTSVVLAFFLEMTLRHAPLTREWFRRLRASCFEPET